MYNESQPLLVHTPMNLNYPTLDQIDIDPLLSILNQSKVREHLVEHAAFDRHSIQQWIQTKTEMDSLEGCHVRAVVLDGELVGWCGIQLEDGHYELAIVLRPEVWGAGLLVFRYLYNTARALGHRELVIHLLASRPRYRFLLKRSRAVYDSELYGQRFTTYVLDVAKQFMAGEET